MNATKRLPWATMIGGSKEIYWMKIRLATRGSALALAQADLVKNALEQRTGAQGEQIEVEVQKVTTHGDVDRTSKLTEIGGKGLFVRGIERELLEGRADIAVHSAKDLPYETAEGLVIAGVPKCADARDVLICAKGRKIGPSLETNHSPVIGTGSPRRVEELKKLFPNAVFRENRGNIETRLRKLKERQFDAIVLAKAGIDRLKLDLSGLDVRILTPEECIPAGCQGILAVECRKDDIEICRILQKISDPATMERFRIERYVFGRLKADCSKAVGVYADVQRGKLILTGMLLGKKEKLSGKRENWKEISDELCKKLME